MGNKVKINPEKFTENRIWVSQSYLINTDDYENHRIEVGVTKSYHDRDPMDVIDYTVEELKTLLMEKVEKIKNPKKSKKRRRTK